MSEGFYAQVPLCERFEQVVDPARHQPVPADWWVLITDVQGSTRAIQEGRYREVNAIGVASIIAVRNALPGLDLPYVFGGDGATLLLPPSAWERVQPALRGLRRLAEERFGLGLRVGAVQVGELVAAGAPVRVGRYPMGPRVSLAIFSGSGVAEAERRLKDPEARGVQRLSEGEAAVDLEGFECRWKPLPARRGRILSLLVEAVEPQEERRTAAYQAALAAIGRALGSLDGGRPVSPDNLRLGDQPSSFRVESLLKADPAPASQRRARYRLWFKVALARLLLAMGWRAGSFDGRRYPAEVAQNSDDRKFDETLRMVLDLEPDRIAGLRAELDVLVAQGRIVYGTHESDEALITCMVGSYDGDHLHFVDGADGGYALAARPLKAMKKQREAAATSALEPPGA